MSKVALRYGSVCSGIEAATTAWHPLGWEPAFFSEIEKHPSSLLKRHYPNVPNHGDMTKFKEWPDHAIDLLVGGTPCQSFSVAGLRKGLADPRGNLMLTYLAIADRYRPQWLVWENVPGVLSSNGGRDFGSFLGGLGQLGYGFAYRVLDAQFVRVESHPRAVPQRRRRVFVVGCLGDWRRAAAVLFERESLQGHPPPRRESGEGFTHGVAPSLVSSGRGVERGGDTRGQDPVVAEVLAFGGNDTRGPIDVATARNAHSGPHGRLDFESETFVAVAPTFRAGGNRTGGDRPYGTDVDTCDSLLPIAIQGAATRENPSSGPDGVGVRTDGAAYRLEARSEVQAVAFAQNQRDEIRTMDVSGALAAEPGMKQQTYVAFSCKDYGGDAGEISPTLRSMGHDGSHANAGGQLAVAFPLTAGMSASAARMPHEQGALIPSHWAVRRLTPLECERLQGFPDGYTAFDHTLKPIADGPRYKALGNSMAVNVMRHIGERIAEVAPNTRTEETT